ncbi:hypothetical protein T484DRAFT_1744936 [Baffinella frigidus]|nr:hypothetical protein T484DRAFT_1744936 [Cryptophyta sp. CCMP2293]
MSHVSGGAWEFKGEYLTISRNPTFIAGAHTGAPEEVVWSHKSDSLEVSKVASFSSTAAAQKSPEERMKSAEEYLEKHQVQSRVQDAVNAVLASMPADPMAAIAAVLAPAPKAVAAPKKEGGEKKEGGDKQGKKEGGKKEGGKKEEKKEDKKTAPSPQKAAAAPAAPAAQVGHARHAPRVRHGCLTKLMRTDTEPGRSVV